MTPDELRGLWNAFRGFEHPYINYSAIIGRWSQLIPKEKERFLSKFGRYGDIILTFDQLARRAIYRPTRQEFWTNSRSTFRTALPLPNSQFLLGHVYRLGAS